ncbi:MAG: hypothetical protein ACT6FE_08200 [Methanosarcinaceae archaeon]
MQLLKRAGCNIWEAGYFARTVGDKVTSDIIKRYIRFHKDNKKKPEQLELF